ncbi:response regulator [Lachnospiraceae bacterium ZAX-1]
MKKIGRFLKRSYVRLKSKYFDERLDIDIQSFNLLACVGILAGIAATVFCIVTGASATNIAVNLLCSGVGVAFIYFANKTKWFHSFYIITVIVVFLFLFPILFFMGGGYRSGMPSFFIFALLFTALMLKKWELLVALITELVVYVSSCFISYFHPDTVAGFVKESVYLWDVVFSMVISGTLLLAVGALYLRIYDNHQRELETAREDALRLSEVKSNFIANMSHEMRTPINVMLGLNEMIIRESDSAQVKSYSLDIENAGKSLLRLINNVLDISKIESGVLPVMDEPYRTADLIASLTLTGTELARRYGLSFNTDMDKTLPSELTGDILHIQQIASNFLSNAAKYTQKGGITLSFGHRPVLDGILLRISVSDTGIGIRDENIPYLFDAFTRADLAKGCSVEGTGLGLAIAKELAAQMGGNIRVESHLGVGSTFSVELPQKISDAAPLGEPPSDPRVEDDALSSIFSNFGEFLSDPHIEDAPGGFIAPGGIVLVVDDNRENLQVTKTLLARTMLRVDTAVSGEKCLEAVRNFRYDVILMDYMMPDMDGIETLHRLWDEHPGFDTPVIALTANVIAGTEQKLLDAGFRQYLSKPVMHRDLEMVLRALLPPTLITKKMRAGTALPPEMLEGLALELAAHGVILENGLRYLSGDIVLYVKVVAVFTTNHEREKNAIEELVANENWGALKFPIHALKSKALSVGADKLSETAEKLDELCVVGDGEYITATLPMLYHEWERAVDGLSAFVERLREELPPEPESEISSGLEELIALIRHNRHPSAIAMLNRLIEGVNGKMTDALREIRIQVDDIEFREAERLLRALMEGHCSGK